MIKPKYPRTPQLDLLAEERDEILAKDEISKEDDARLSEIANQITESPEFKAYNLALLEYVEVIMLTKFPDDIRRKILNTPY